MPPPFHVDGSHAGLEVFHRSIRTVHGWAATLFKIVSFFADVTLWAGLRSVSMKLVIRDRQLEGSDLSTIRALIQAEGGQVRSHLSRRLCRLWHWRQANGACREIACRDRLRQMEQRHLIELPAPLHAARRPGCVNRVEPPGIPTDRIDPPLDRIKARIQIAVAETPAQRRLLRDLLGAYHYPGYRQPTGLPGLFGLLATPPGGLRALWPGGWKVAVRDRPMANWGFPRSLITTVSLNANLAGAARFPRASPSSGGEFRSSS